MGTDTFRYSAAKIVKDPFTERPILIPACFPDVAIIHVHRCDEYGNAQIDGILVEDFELARAAKRLILCVAFMLLQVHKDFVFRRR